MYRFSWTFGWVNTKNDQQNMFADNFSVKYMFKALYRINITKIILKNLSLFFASSLVTFTSHDMHDLNTLSQSNCSIAIM